jgi:hypothetical protein
VLAGAGLSLCQEIKFRSTPCCGQGRFGRECLLPAWSAGPVLAKDSSASKAVVKADNQAQPDLSLNSDAGVKTQIRLSP